MLPPVDLLEVPGDDLDPLDERLDAGIPARFIDTAQGVIAYREVGDPASPALIATHAVPLSSLSWVSVAPYVAERGLRFLAFDMPGYGFTPPAPMPLTIPEYGAVIGALADALGLGRFGLVGNATFAAAALHYAVTSPHRVTRVVFTHFPYFPDPERLANAQPTWYHPDGTPPKIPMGSIQPRVSPQRFAVLRTRMAFDMYRSGPRSAEGYRALAAYDLLGDLSRLTIPTRFVWGEGDQFLPHHDVVLAAARPAKPEVVILAGATYAPAYERPRAEALAIASFFDAVSA